MSNKYGFATPSAGFGALAGDSIHATDEEKTTVAKMVRAHLPGDDGDEILAILGLDEPQPGE